MTGGIELMRHALGVQRLGKTWSAPFRNHFVAGGDDVAAWDALVADGLAIRKSSGNELTGGDPLYMVTDAGRTVALDGLKFRRRA
jgi:hypothetical protein